MMEWKKTCCVKSNVRPKQDVTMSLFRINFSFNVGVIQCSRIRAKWKTPSNDHKLYLNSTCRMCECALRCRVVYNTIEDGEVMRVSGKLRLFPHNQFCGMFLQAEIDFPVPVKRLIHRLMNSHVLMLCSKFDETCCDSGERTTVITSCRQFAWGCDGRSQSKEQQLFALVNEFQTLPSLRFHYSSDGDGRMMGIIIMDFRRAEKRRRRDKTDVKLIHFHFFNYTEKHRTVHSTGEAEWDELNAEHAK